jgi:hypothetical protein
MSESLAWRIDSIDARAGLAFGSCRDADLRAAAGFPSLSADGLAVAVSPPAFEARSLSSRATGLSATRGSFQMGLFVRGQEVGFRSLEDLCEFVRRVYLRGGAGDGPDAASGQPMPPMPPSEPPEMPPLPEAVMLLEESHSGTFFGENLADFRRFSNELSPDMDIVQTRWLHSDSWLIGESGDPGRRKADLLKDGNSLLEMGCLGVFYEISCKALSYPTGESAIVICNYLEHFLAACARVGLYDRVRAYFHAVSGKSSDLEFPAWFSERVWGDDWWPWTHPYQDPVEDLSVMPLPKEIAHICTAPVAEDRSVWNLLMGIAGAPGCIDRLASSRSRLLAEGLILFAATCLTSPSYVPDSVAVNLARTAKGYPNWGELNYNRRMPNLVRAWDWLSQQLPAAAFPSALENVILGASDLAYASDQG